MNKNSNRDPVAGARTSSQDEGCELAPSCLGCPFPACIKEEMGGGKRWLKSLRDRQIAQLRDTTNISIAELGRRFKVNKRTVYRALKKKANAFSSEELPSDSDLDSGQSLNLNLNLNLKRGKAGN